MIDQDKNKSEENTTVVDETRQQSFNPSRRKMSAWLMAGVVVLPFVFSWFTLRKEYSGLSRGVALAWMVGVLAVSASSGFSEYRPKRAADNEASRSNDRAATAQTKPVVVEIRAQKSSPEDRINEYADRISARGGYACNGIATQLRMAVRAQGAASPYVTRLLDEAQAKGCL